MFHFIVLRTPIVTVGSEKDCCLTRSGPQCKPDIVILVKYLIEYTNMRYCDTGVTSHEIYNYEKL